MKKLDIHTWKELKSPRTLDPFYASTEPVFLRHRVQDWDDVLRLAAYAWSWMPTVPDIHLKFADSKTRAQIVAGIQGLQTGKIPDLGPLLVAMVKIFNHSIVGVSKMLYFAAPDWMPIIDSKVRQNWNTLFGYDKNLRIGSVHYAKDDDGYARHVDAYLKYRKLLLAWREVIPERPSLREMEMALFLYGKDGVPSEKSVVLSQARGLMFGRHSARGRCLVFRYDTYRRRT